MERKYELYALEESFDCLLGSYTEFSLDLLPDSFCPVQEFQRDLYDVCPISLGPCKIIKISNTKASNINLIVTHLLLNALECGIHVKAKKSKCKFVPVLHSLSTTP
jgi:hypothetical protein